MTTTIGSVDQSCFLSSRRSTAQVAEPADLRVEPARGRQDHAVVGGDDPIPAERREVDAVMELLAVDDPRTPWRRSERQRQATVAGAATGSRSAWRSAAAVGTGVGVGIRRRRPGGDGRWFGCLGRGGAERVLRRRGSPRPPTGSGAGLPSREGRHGAGEQGHGPDDDRYPDEQRDDAANAAALPASLRDVIEHRRCVPSRGSRRKRIVGSEVFIVPSTGALSGRVPSERSARPTGHAA